LVAPEGILKAVTDLEMRPAAAKEKKKEKIPLENDGRRLRGHFNSSPAGRLA